ncbi:MAG: phosphotransferase [Spirochaetaceae bacterium]
MAYVYKYMTEILKKVVPLFGFTNKIKDIGTPEKLKYICSKDSSEYILKVIHSKDNQIQELMGEVNFVNYLSKNGANVQSYIKSINNVYIETILLFDVEYYVLSYQKSSGKKFSFSSYFNTKKWDHEILQSWGNEVGRLVSLSKKYTFKDVTSRRPEWYNDPIIKNYSKYVPLEQTKVQSKIEECLADLHSQNIAESTFGLIQGDFHRWNFYFDGNNITMEDFDDCEYHWFVNEIAMPLFYGMMKVPEDKLLGFSEFFMTNFLKGFRSVCSIEKEQLAMIPKFLKLRLIILYVLFYKENPTSKSIPEHIVKWKKIIESDKQLIDLDFSKY